MNGEKIHKFSLVTFNLGKISEIKLIFISEKMKIINEQTLVESSQYSKKINC